VRSLPEQQVTLKKATNNYLEVRSGPSEFRIVGLPAEDFPALPKFDRVPFRVTFTRRGALVNDVHEDSGTAPSCGMQAPSSPRSAHST
jgi:hypothetical protein